MAGDENSTERGRGVPEARADTAGPAPAPPDAGGVRAGGGRERVSIFDTTLRDGEQSPGCSMNLAEKIRVAEALARLGVDVIEAGFPIASPGDFEAVRTIARRVSGVTICGLARCQRADIGRAWEAIRDAERARIHVFLATSAIHREFKLGMARDEIVRRAIDGVAQARSVCADVEFSPEDAARTEPDFLAEVVEAAIDAGATTINVPDTVGYATPAEFGALFAYLRRTVRGIGGVTLSVHCHDDLGMAVANSLAAVSAGARQVECTINGIGERAGNASLEEIVMALRTRADVFGVDTGVDATRLHPASRLVAAVTGSFIPRNKAIVGENAFAHEAGIHQHGVLCNRATYEIMRPQDVGFHARNLVLGKHSGRHAIRSRVEELGYAIDDEQLGDIVRRFKPLADKKKVVLDADLEALVLGHDPSADGPWRLDALSTGGGTGSLQTATVELTHVPTGRRVAEASVGDGPVDATFKAIARATEVDMILRDYRVRSVSGGEDAQGEAVIDAEIGGRVLHGRGVSTDIVEATGIGILEVVNRSAQIRERASEGAGCGSAGGVS